VEGCGLDGGGHGYSVGCASAVAVEAEVGLTDGRLIDQGSGREGEAE
jgi:hypothetical protein